MKAPALTIRKRIYGGSAILVAVSIGLAIFAVDQATTTGAQVARLGLLSDNNTRVLQVDRNLEGIRRTARSYKTNGDPVALKENREVVARTTQTLTDASKATLSDDRRRGYEDLKEDLVKYSAKMDTQVSLTNDMIRDRSKLFQGGDELTATTNRLMEAVHKQNDPNLNVLAANVEAAILLVRVSNWRYLATLDPKGPVTFKTNTEKAGAAITGLEASAGLAADIRALIGQLKTTLAAYVDTFQLLSSGMVATDAVFDNESRPLVLKMQNSVNTLRDSIQESYTNTQESTKQVVLNSIRTQQAMGIIVFLVGSGIALLLSRGLIRPIAGMTTAMSALADGDTNVVVPMRDAPDEMGAMAKAVDVFKDNAIERRRLEESQKQREADAAMEKQRAMEALANTFEDAVSEIIETVSASASQLEASAHSLTATATRSEEVTTTVAAASEEASVNVHSVAAATEELTSSVHEISRQVQASARIASEAVEQAGKTNGQIALLSEAANRIGNVVQLISTIAGQTNLLALNATIEAARAGEAGRGFAVVASEVKTLAKQTADATYEISQQIAGMQAATGQSVDAIQEIGATIGKMSEISSAIASAVEQQNAATQEISNNVQQAAQGTQEVSSHITGVQRGAAETGSASSQVLSAAQSLARDSQRLKSEVTKFLHTVRAAA